MRWSWRFANIAGVIFYLHATFLLLFLWVALLYWQQRQGLGSVVECFVFMLAILASVFVHDLGHLAAARKLGIRLRTITLLPLGGVVSLRSVPKDRMKGVWIAIAGPGVSILVAATLYALVNVTASLVPLHTLHIAQGPFWQRLLWVNLFLAGFNLLPALPMDGGFALRSILMGNLGYSKANQMTASLGQVATFLLGLAGFWTVSPFLLFLALSVWIGSTREAGSMQMRSALRGVPVSRVMARGVQSLSSENTVDDAAKMLGPERQRDFPVVEEGKIIGILTHQELLSALAEGNNSSSVVEMMNATTQCTNPSEMLDIAISRMLDCDCSALPVVQGEQLVGVLTQERIGEFVSGIR